MVIRPTEPEFDVRRRAKLVELLSMDVVSPFFDLMGLRAGGSEHLPRVLRRFTVAGRKRMADPPLGPAEVIQAVSDSIGADAARQLVWWEQNVFSNHPRDNLELQFWTTVLLSCRNETDGWRRLGFPDPIRDEALDRLNRALNIAEYSRRQDDVDARPLSDWDLHLYAVHLYDDNLYLDDMYRVPDGPRLWILPTIRNYQEYCFWAWALKALRPDQLDRLWQVAQRIVVDDELTSVQTLPHPSVLEIGL